MKQKIQRFTGFLITVCLIIAGIFLLGHIVRPTDTDGAYSQIETFHGLPENSLEVIVYGSSHAYKGVNTMQMYQSHGIGAYNYGWNWQKLNTITLFLKDSLLRQTPKIALIETYTCNDLLIDQNISAEIYYSRYIHHKDPQKEYLRQCFGNDWNRYATFYMPLSAFHDNWNTLTFQSFMPLRVDSDNRRHMGFYATDAVTPITLPDPAAFPQETLFDHAVAELDKIVAVCRENGIEIVFFTVPYQANSAYENDYSYSNAMQAYADANGYPYLNLFEHIDEMGLDENTDFADIGHLNTSGANKVADFLGSYIVEHYDVTDMRTIEGNLWQQALEQ